MFQASIFKSHLGISWCRLVLLLFFVLISITRGIGTAFLLVPSTVSELALGPSPVIGDQTHFNPSRIKDGRWMSASGGTWIANIPISGIRARGPFLNGKFSFQGRYVGIDDLELRPDHPEDEPLSLFSAYGLSLSGAGAWTGKKLSLGGALSYIDLGIYSEFSRGVSLSAGVEYRLTQDIILGASILNIGRMSDLRKEPPSLPLRSSFGARFDREWNDWESGFGISADWTNGSDPILRMAEKVTWKGFTVLAGTSFQKDNFNISGGVNFYVGFFRIGYGFLVGQNRLGIAQLVEISLNMK